MKWNEAIRAVAACEKDLRRLVADAAREGDYAAVQRITDLAKALAALCAEGRPAPPPPTTSSSKHRDHQRPSNGAPAPSARPAPHAASNGYPRFFRRGDDLVKVGWSKTERKEYNHRAPRRALDAVAAAIRRAGANGRLFNGDALLPLSDPADGSRLPDYQAYVALGWLKHLGLIHQRGQRTGYTLAHEEAIESTVASAWPELAEWQG